MLKPDERAMREIEDGLQIADRSGADLALRLARRTLGFALVQRHKDAERDRRCKVLAEIANCSHARDTPPGRSTQRRGVLGA